VGAAIGSDARRGGAGRPLLARARQRDARAASAFEALRARALRRAAAAGGARRSRTSIRHRGRSGLRVREDRLEIALRQGARDSAEQRDTAEQPARATTNAPAPQTCPGLFA